MFDSGQFHNPRASIVIPLLNQLDSWLEQAVLSAVRQTVLSEVVVVVSQKTAESNLRLLGELQAQHSNLQVICREPGTAFPAALNVGIRHATADRIGFLMSDDWLEPNAVELCLAFDEDIVSTSRTFYAADGRTVLTELTLEHTPEAYRALQKPADQASFLEHFLLIRREALQRVGGVDETLGVSPGVDDFDMIWCMLEQGATAAIIAQPLYNYRDHEGERLTRYKRDEMLATFNRILDKHGVSGAERSRILQDHSPWFGTSIWAHYCKISPRRDRGPLLGALQRLYRRALPLKTRLAIHDRLFDWTGLKL
jgi:glycosyltransferase involved in cell wall biosynthesis